MNMIDISQGKCEMCKVSVPLRGTSCTYGEILAALAFRLRRTLAPSALDARASRSLYLSVTHTRSEPLTKAKSSVTHDCNYLQHSTFRFSLIDFQLNTDSLSNFAIFTVKSPSVTQRSVSQENSFVMSKNPSPFFRKDIGSSNSFILIENNFKSF